MNRQLASFDIFVIVSELQDLIGNYIDKIYQLSKEDILIKIRNVEEKKKESIFIRNGTLICRTEKNILTPMKPSTFAMTLRKYLSNAKIESIAQHDFDRIIVIKCRKGPKMFTLILEIFSQGNIILLDENDTIIRPFKQEEWSHRLIRSKESYRPPPSQQNPFNISKSSFLNIIEESDADIVRTLAAQLNMGGAYAEEVCKQADINKNRQTSTLSNEEVLKIYETFSKMLTRFKQESFQPVVVKKNDDIVDILPFKFLSYPNDLTFEKASQMLHGLAAYLLSSDTSEETIQTPADRKKQKLERRLSQQKKAIDELKSSIKRKQIEGELIYLHFQECEQLLTMIQQAMNQKEKKDVIKKIQHHPLVKTFQPNKNMLVVKLTDLEKQQYEVPLDFRKSVTENAENAYDTSKKYKQKREGAIKAIQETKKQIEKINKQGKKETTQSIQIRKQPEKTFWFETYRWCLSSNGNIIIGGKDAKSNDQLVKKHLQKEDRYAHADVHGAPSCVVKKRDVHDEPLEITEQTLLEACIFSACYSKAWKQFVEAQAYWVHPNQVSKTPQSGEYVPRGAFIIRGNRHYCNCKLELGIGKTVIQGTKKIMGGPIDSVKKWCSAYVIITPGNTKKTTAAHTIAKQLNTSIDEINTVLPSGDVAVTSTHISEKQDHEEA